MFRAIFLAVSLLCLDSATALAQESGGRGCGDENKKWCHLQSVIGELPNLAGFLQGAEGKAKQFANAAFDNPSMQEQEWRLFDGLLGGGKLDPGGALIRGEISRLPPEQWYYVIRLEDHRRILVQLGGGVYGNLIEGSVNMFSPKDAELHVMKCHEQGETLMRNMGPVKSSGRPRSVFQDWSPLLVTAKFQTLREHNAPCFRYAGPEGPVEIVADSWADVLVPARVWWQEYDPAALSQLSGGNGVCGPSYERWDLARVGALMKKEDEQMKRIEDAKKRMQSLFH